jgi:hypothetical protein
MLREMIIEEQPGEIPAGPKFSNCDPYGKLDGWKPGQKGGPQTAEVVTSENYLGMSTLKQWQACVMRHLGVKRVDRRTKNRYLPESSGQQQSLQFGGQTIRVENQEFKIPFRDIYEEYVRKRDHEWVGISQSDKGVYHYDYIHYRYFQKVVMLIRGRYAYLLAVILWFVNHETYKVYGWEGAWRYCVLTVEQHFSKHALEKPMPALDVSILSLMESATENACLTYGFMSHLVTTHLDQIRLNQAIAGLAVGTTTRAPGAPAIPAGTAPRATGVPAGPGAGRDGGAGRGTRNPAPTGPGAAAGVGRGRGNPGGPPAAAADAAAPGAPGGEGGRHRLGRLCPLCHAPDHDYRLTDYSHPANVPITRPCNARNPADANDVCGLMHARTGPLASPCRF